MSEVFLVFGSPRTDDPQAALVVQENIKALAEMFTRGTADGDVLTWDNTLGKYVAAAGVAVPMVGTTLPATPNDYQEAIVMNSTTAPTWAWRFIYIPTISDAYKWVCFGGKAAIQTSGTSAGTTGSSGVWTNYSTDALACRFDLPFEGYYEFRFGCTGEGNAAASNAWDGLSTNGGDPGPNVYTPSTFTGGPVTNVDTQLVTGSTRYVRLMHQDGDSTRRILTNNRSIQIMPMRVKAA